MKRLMILIFMGLILGGLGLMVNHVAAGGSTIVVTTTADVDVNIDGQCSLREAIIAANTNTPSGIVLGECPAGSDTSEDFIVLTSGESYTLAIAGKDEDAGLTGDLDIVDDIDSEILADVVIITDEAGQATIDGAGVDRVLHLLGARVRLDNLVVRGGNPGAASGGGVLNESGHLAVSDSQIILNESSLGGGIASKEGELRLTDVIVRINVATQGGGLGLVGNTAVSLNNSDITLNTANEGGGIYADAANGAITIEGGSVSNNGTASGAGGGLYVASSSPVTIDQTSISENETTSGVEVGHGAGIYMGDAASMLHVRNASIEQNTADAFGGGIFSHGTVVMTRTMVMSNTAVSGGGVHISEGQQITVTSSGFVHNAAMGNAGGGIMAAKASLVASTVSQNSAVVGAGIYADELTATYVEFVNNRADSWGGAVMVTNSLRVEGASFVDNEAQNSGAAIMFSTVNSEAGSLIRNTYFDNNITLGDGGAIWMNGLLTVANTTISRNYADEGSGGGLFVGAGGEATLLHVSLVKNVAVNGYNIFKEGEVTLQNTLIALGDTNCMAVATPFNSLGNNLSDDDTCDGLDEPTDQTNVEAMVDMALADNGGFTLTHALLEGSPAIDAADDVACASEPVNGRDQRGVDRTVLGTACDIGAYEYGTVHTIYLPVVVKQ